MIVTEKQRQLNLFTGDVIAIIDEVQVDDDVTDPKILRRQNNLRALELIESGEFDRAEVFRLYTGLGGLIDAEDGESFLAGSHKAIGQYFTPSKVARLIVDLLGIPPGARVFDNCCGHGAMFWYLPRGCYATGIELQEEAYRVATALYPNQTIINGDCLDYHVDGQFHYALINPPFGLNWQTDLNLDLIGYGGKILSQVACLELAIRSVVPSGYVAVILPRGTLRKPHMVSFRRWYRNQARVVAVIDLPKAIFREQGTDVESSLIILKKLPALDRETFRFVVGPADSEPATGVDEGTCFARLRRAWQKARVSSDVLRFASEIEDCGPAVINKRVPSTGGERAAIVPHPASLTVTFEGLLLKKGRYAVIPQAGDVLTALKLAEIREVRCEKDYWSKTDEYRDITSLSAFYTGNGNPSLLDLLEAYQIDWQYDPQLAHWISRKRRCWQRQQFVYQMYQSVDGDDAGTVAEDHFPPEYQTNRRRLDMLGLSPFLFEYQQMDAARLACKPFNALLYDMGLGKTRTAIATALLAGSKRIVIVCLSRLVKVWIDEFQKLGIDDFTVVRSVNDVDKLKRFAIVSYEKLSREERLSLDQVDCPSCGKSCATLRCDCGWKRTRNLVCPKCKAEAWRGHSCRSCGYVDRVWVPALTKRLRRIQWGMVIVDESQMMKTKNSLRSQAVSSLKAKRKLLLTGTLIKGYVPDMFWQLHWCFGGGSPGFPYPWRGGAKKFIDQFATYEYVSDEYQDRIQGKKKMVPKVNNLPLFWELMGPKVIRRLVDDPLVKQSIQLPPKNVEVIMVEMNPEQKAVYDWWYENFVEWYRQQLELEEQDADYTIKNAAILGQLWKLRQAATCPHIFTGEDGGPVYQGNCTNKHKALWELVENLPEGDKVVIFTGYNPNARLVAEKLDTTCLIGSTPIPVRNEAIERFQNEPQPSLLVVGLLAMNLGQTLTRASHAFMTDLDWCPSSMVQAEGRLLRISQEQPVNVTYLLSRGTIDEDMYELIYQKQAAINEAIDHKSRTEKVTPLSIRDFVDEMLKRREKRK
jgi:hypothetical protein